MIPIIPKEKINVIIILIIRSFIIFFIIPFTKLKIFNHPLMVKLFKAKYQKNTDNCHKQNDYK